jgi:hypothetical protein
MTAPTGIRAGEPLELIAEPDNPHDENAIKVLREDGKQIGYVKRSLVARLVDDLSDFRAFVAGIGRGRDGRYLGVSLLIVVHDGEDDAAVEAYARRVPAEDREVPDRSFRRRSRQPTDSRATMSHTDRSIALVVIIIAVAVVVAIALLR